MRDTLLITQAIHNLFLLFKCKKFQTFTQKNYVKKSDNSLIRCLKDIFTIMESLSDINNVCQV